MIIQLFTNNGYWGNYERVDDHSDMTAKILALISESSGVDTAFKGSDRLAALAYRSGRYDMAATLLKTSGESALSWWLRAKMALRDGDVKVATAAYAKAASGFPPDEIWGVAPDDPQIVYGSNLLPGCRVAGLRVSRGFWR